MIQLRKAELSDCSSVEANFCSNTTPVIPPVTPPVVNPPPVVPPVTPPAVDPVTPPVDEPVTPPSEEEPAACTSSSGGFALDAGNCADGISKAIGSQIKGEKSKQNINQFNEGLKNKKSNEPSFFDKVKSATQEYLKDTNDPDVLKIMERKKS
jgi:hypothetical protein